MPLLDRTIGGSITLDIAASPDTVWEVVTDTENAPRIVTNLLEQEIVKNSEGGVGMAVREVRILNGKKRESFRTITAITSNPYSVSVNVYLNKTHALLGKDNAARTGSWTIVEGNDERSSVFVWSYSAIPGGLRESLLIILFKPFILRTIKKHFEQDLRDYATEAERRQELKDRAASNDGSTPK